MMYCRMCSQRLPRPGKLCRECERELQRARAAAASVDNLSSAVPLIDAARMESDSIGWAERIRSGPTMLVTAFSVGIATAAALYVMQGTHAAGKSESVMLDRDLRNVQTRNYRGVTGAARIEVAPDAAVDAVEPRKPTPASDRREPVVVKIASTAARSAATAPASTPQAAAPIALAAPQPAPAYDRVLGLATALDACAGESLFVRIACEHRARTRYCEGAAHLIPQCAEPSPREYGQ